MRVLILMLMLIFKFSYTQEKSENCIKSKDNSRIMCAGGSITEIIYLLQEQEKIVAVDVTSIYP